MIKKILAVLMLLILLTMSTASAQNTNRNQGELEVPAHSRIVDLGNGMMRYDHVHYDSDSVFVNEALEDGYLLMGIKWHEAEPFVVNPFKSGIDDDTVLTIITDSLNTWDVETDFEVFGDVSINPSVRRARYDEKNSVTFKNLDKGIIGVCYTWWYTGTDQIVESDVMFSTRYSWSATGDPNKMDLQNIATHEFGHSAGLLDIYDPDQNHLTMYGYSWFGDIEKQTLAPGDIAGIRAIYSPLNPSTP